MYKLSDLPVMQMAAPAGGDQEKLEALVEAYASARCASYTARAGTRDFIVKQQAEVALGNALIQALAEVVMYAQRGALVVEEESNNG